MEEQPWAKTVSGLLHQIQYQEPAEIIAIVLIRFTLYSRALCRIREPFRAKNSAMAVMLKFSHREIIFID